MSDARVLRGRSRVAAAPDRPTAQSNARKLDRHLLSRVYRTARILERSTSSKFNSDGFPSYANLASYREFKISPCYAFEIN